QAEDGIRDKLVTGVQTCALPISGMTAGAATKNGTIGLVVAYPIPEVIRHTNAFALGAQAMHPGVKVKLVWTHSWFDPAKEKRAEIGRASCRERGSIRVVGEVSNE